MSALTIRLPLTFQISPRVLQITFGALLLMPIFLSVSGGGIALAERYTRIVNQTPTFPLSTFWMPPFLMLSLYLHNWRIRLRKIDIFVGLYLFGMTGGYLIGTVFELNDASKTGQIGYLLRYLQTVSPLAAYFTVRILIGQSNTISSDYLPALKNIIVAFVSCMVITAILYVAQTLISGANVFRFSLIADHIGPFYNFKMLRFYPIALSIVAIILFSHFLYLPFESKWRKISLAMALGVCVIIATTWSRTAILMLAVGTLSTLVFSFRGLKVQRPARIGTMIGLPILLAWIAAIGLASIIDFSLDRLLSTLSSLVNLREGLEAGDQMRFQRMKTAFTEGVMSPFGDYFRMHSQPLVPGKKLLIADNGYINIAVRGGPLAMLSVMALSLWACRTYFVLAKSIFRRSQLQEYFPVIAGLFGLTVSITFIGNVWINIATEPYIAPLFWAILALTWDKPINLDATGSAVST